MVNGQSSGNWDWGTMRNSLQTGFSPMNCILRGIRKLQIYWGYEYIGQEIIYQEWQVNSQRHINSNSSRQKWSWQSKDVPRPRRLFIVNFVSHCWAEGDPIGKIELTDELAARDDCAELSSFWKKYLDPAAPRSGLTNYMKRVFDCLGFSMRIIASVRLCQRTGTHSL